MEKLYALSISGTTYFLKGRLSLQECQLIDHLSKEFKRLPSEEELDFCERFLETINNKLNIKLHKIPINYVFRIDGR